MANIDRLINHADGLSIIDGLTKIRYAINPELDPLQSVSFSTASDSRIVEIVNALDSGDISISNLSWDVGDERVVNLNAIPAGDYNVAHAAQTVTLVIMQRGAYNGTGHFVIGFKECLLEEERIEITKTNQNGWHDSRGRKCCDAIFYMIPANLQPIFKTFTVYTATKGDTDTPGVTAQSGKLALFAEKEVIGIKGYCTSSEFNDSRISQIPYYKVSANRIKTLGTDGAATKWWTRSPRLQGSGQWCAINEAGTQAPYEANTTANLYFAPFGVI